MGKPLLAPPEPEGGVEDEDSDLVFETAFQTLQVASPQHHLLTQKQAIECLVTERCLTVSASSTEPKSWREAMARPDRERWLDAARSEIQAHIDNGTWELVELPSGRQAIGSRWVFKIKRDANGEIERYKARLVAKGYAQRPGVDYNETWAPTATWAAIKAILALGAIHDLEIHSVDVSNAYLNGRLPPGQSVFMEQPEGFVETEETIKVCRLQKGLYGLKQSGRLWYEELGKVLGDIGFTRCVSDASIYVWEKEGIKVIVPAFVDDLTLVSKSITLVEETKAELAKRLKIRDLGPISFLLGVSITRDRAKRKMELSQHQYCIDLLHTAGMSNAAPVTTPMDPGLNLSKIAQPTPEEAKDLLHIKREYMSLVGGLNYLAIATRPDISYAVGKLARYSSNPGKAHHRALKHLLRYVAGTIDLKLTYSPDPAAPSPFVSFCDSAFADDDSNGRSTHGYLVKVGTGAVSWASKLQSVVATSSTEAEFYGAAFVGAEIKWMRELFNELGYPIVEPSPLFMDNQGTIKNLQANVDRSKMKHIPVKEFWIRDEVNVVKSISLHYMPGTTLPADLLTKPLPRATVVTHRESMGLF